MRVLFVCTQNICRSRVAERIFQVLARAVDGHGHYEARSAGTQPEIGGRAVTRADVEWADVVCAMEGGHEAFIRHRWPGQVKKVRVFGIPDVYPPYDQGLHRLLTAHIGALLAEGRSDLT